MSVVFGLFVLDTEKGPAIILGKATRPKFFGKWTKSLNKFENTQIPLEYPNR